MKVSAFGGVLTSVCLISLISSSASLAAQVAGSAASSSAQTEAPDPDSGMAGHVEGLFIPLVTGQPFHAKIAVMFTRQLPDGTTVAQKYYTLAARDDSGREYREARNPVPADSDREPSLVHSTVYDPKESTITTCTPDQRICRQTRFDPTQHPVEEAVGPSSDGKSTLKREDLGTKTMDGLQVIGTRETRTFNPGAFGNDKPVVVTKELWYSPQLQFNLSVTRMDPRNGTQKLEVTDLKLGDPGQDWFVIPDGYRLVQGRGIQMRPVYPAELEPLIEKMVPSMTHDQLETALEPVEAAIGVLTKAHAAAAPNDKSDVFAGRMRSQLSLEFHIMQDNRLPQRNQLPEANLRMNETYREVVNSPCIDKPQPGDPPTAPSNADTVRAEQTAWLALRDAWTAFLAKLFPYSDPTALGWLITNDRESELRRIANVERNRGCAPVESIEPLLVRTVTGMTADQLDAAVKPVDAAIQTYVKAHQASAPNEQNQDFQRQIEQQLFFQLQNLQRSRIPSQDEYEEADLHLRQAFRSIIASPCLSKPIPADPPNAPVSEEKLRAEQQAWSAMRDAWTAFLAKLFPDAPGEVMGTMLTQQRTGELLQIQNIERNRGCVPAE